MKKKSFRIKIFSYLQTNIQKYPSIEYNILFVYHIVYIVYIMKSILYSGSRSRILEEWRFVVETERGLRKIAAPKRIVSAASTQ